MPLKFGVDGPRGCRVMELPSASAPFFPPGAGRTGARARRQRRPTWERLGAGTFFRISALYFSARESARASSEGSLDSSRSAAGSPRVWCVWDVGPESYAFQISGSAEGPVPRARGVRAPRGRSGSVRARVPDVPLKFGVDAPRGCRVIELQSSSAPFFPPGAGRTAARARRRRRPTWERLVPATFFRISALYFSARESARASSEGSLDSSRSALGPP